MERYDDRVGLVIQGGTAYAINRHSNHPTEQQVASKPRGAPGGQFSRQDHYLRFITGLVEGDADVIRALYLHHARRDTS
jgi:hypothetical protein